MPYRRHALPIPPPSSLPELVLCCRLFEPENFPVMTPPFEKDAAMSRNEITPLDRSLARMCELCPVCRHAADSQGGMAFTFVKSVEAKICPFCRAYEKVHGIKAHEARK
jgi:hypothetical protein